MCRAQGVSHMCHVSVLNFWTVLYPILNSIIVCVACSLSLCLSFYLTLPSSRSNCGRFVHGNAFLIQFAVNKLQKCHPLCLPRPPRPYMQCNGRDTHLFPAHTRTFCGFVKLFRCKWYLLICGNCRANLVGVGIVNALHVPEQSELAWAVNFWKKLRMFTQQRTANIRIEIVHQITNGKMGEIPFN